MRVIDRKEGITFHFWTNFWKRSKRFESRKLSNSIRKPSRPSSRLIFCPLNIQAETAQDQDLVHTTLTKPQPKPLFLWKEERPVGQLNLSKNCIASAFNRDMELGKMGEIQRVWGQAPSRYTFYRLRALIMQKCVSERRTSKICEIQSPPNNKSRHNLSLSSFRRTSFTPFRPESGSPISDGLVSLLHPDHVHFLQSAAASRNSSPNFGRFLFDDLLTFFRQLADIVALRDGRHVAAASQVVGRVFGADDRR